MELIFVECTKCSECFVTKAEPHTGECPTCGTKYELINTDDDSKRG